MMSFLGIRQISVLLFVLNPQRLSAMWVSEKEEGRFSQACGNRPMMGCEHPCFSFTVG
jgi:hypothetical protein